MAGDVVLDTRSQLGEGPLWNESDGWLYWVDILGGTLHRYNPQTTEHEVVLNVKTITGTTLQRDGSLLTFHRCGEVGRYTDGALTQRKVFIPDTGPTRFNDVIADPNGRVFCGTMPTDDRGGDLFRIDPEGTSHTIETDLAIPNGMAFTQDRETFYFTESEAHTVYAYDYDESTGALSNCREFIDTTDKEGVPDGLTIDESGRLWSAQYGGGYVVRYEPDGTEIERYRLDCERPTSVCFGGENCSRLFVTTAGGDNREQFGRAAGALLELDVAATGRPEYRSNLDW